MNLTGQRLIGYCTRTRISRHQSHYPVRNPNRKSGELTIGIACLPRAQLYVGTLFVAICGYLWLFAAFALFVLSEDFVLSLFVMWTTACRMHLHLTLSRHLSSWEEGGDIPSPSSYVCSHLCSSMAICTPLQLGVAIRDHFWWCVQLLRLLVPNVLLCSVPLFCWIRDP